MDARSVNLVPVLLYSAIMLAGGGATAPSQIGFLAEYSNLERQLSGALRCVASPDVALRVDRFVFDPAVAHHHNDLEIPGR